LTRPSAGRGKSLVLDYSALAPNRSDDLGLLA
jgi:hypothetical protein